MRTLRPTALLLAVLMLGLVLAQDTGAATVQLGTDTTYGKHLTDAQGNSLYLYAEDSPDESTCVDVCVGNWPPLTTDGTPVAGTGVDASLLGTIKRADGTLQVTYDGSPLYRYVRDLKPGDINGQRLGDVFFLVSAGGQAVKEATAEPEAPVDATAVTTLMTEGQQVFTANCAVCHGAEGQGQVGPAFVNNSNLGNTKTLIDTILGGIPDHGMPAWQDTLSDEQIAAVATFIRNSWGNGFGPVTPDQVTAQR